MSRRFLSLLLPIVLAGIPGHASTLSHNPAAPGWVQETFSVEDGLPSAGLNQVLALEAAAKYSFQVRPPFRFLESPWKCVGVG